MINNSVDVFFFFLVCCGVVALGLYVAVENSNDFAQFCDNEFGADNWTLDNGTCEGYCMSLTYHCINKELKQ